MTNEAAAPNPSEMPPASGGSLAEADHSLFSPENGYDSFADLAKQLSRLAGIQGRSVPSYRFEYLAESGSGVPIAQLSPALRAIELWADQFPGGSREVVDLSQIDRDSFPLLWLNLEEQKVSIARGRLVSGEFSLEDVNGSLDRLPEEQVAKGILLKLKVGISQTFRNDPRLAPKTASEWFLFVVKKHSRLFLEACLASIAASVVAMATAMYTMQVYDRVVPNNGFDTLWALTFAVVIGIAFEFLMKQIRVEIVERSCKAIDIELSQIFFGKALDIRLDARPPTVGTFASQIRHFEGVRNFMTSSTLFVLADTPLALIFIFTIMLIAGPVALVPFLILPLAVFAGMVFRRPVEDATFEHMKDSNYKNGLLIEAIDGIESIKSVNAEWKLRKKWRELTERIALSELRVKKYSQTSMNLTQLIQQLSYVGIVAVGVYQISQGDLTMGGLIACTIISGRAMGPMAQLPNMIVQWKQAQIAIQALDKVMELPNDREAGASLVVPDSCQGDLQLVEAKFRYSSDTADVLNVQATLRIAPGERVAIVGTVGSGKTTALKLLAGLYAPTDGSVLLDNIDIRQISSDFVREHIGYLPQDVRLFNGTLRENLTLGMPTPSDAEIYRIAALTGLDQAIKSNPKGLDLLISEGGRGLSGGQRQLVGITRLLLAGPKVMLLDEPTASMDSRSEDRVMQHFFESTPAGTTMVLVTHKPSVLRYVGRILVVSEGKFVLDGSRDEVLARLQKAA
jgi:ATP-binding cassette subfamily C protein LapB